MRFLPHFLVLHLNCWLLLELSSLSGSVEAFFESVESSDVSLAELQVDVTLNLGAGTGTCCRH